MKLNGIIQHLGLIKIRMATGKGFFGGLLGFL